MGIREIETPRGVHYELTWTDWAGGERVRRFVEREAAERFERRVRELFERADKEGVMNLDEPKGFDVDHPLAWDWLAAWLTDLLEAQHPGYRFSLTADEDSLNGSIEWQGQSEEEATRESVDRERRFAELAQRHPEIVGDDGEIDYDAEEKLQAAMRAEPDLFPTRPPRQEETEPDLVPRPPRKRSGPTIFGAAYGLDDPDARVLLQTSSTTLVDHMCDEIAAMLRDREPIGWVVDDLPPMFSEHYNVVFYKQFLVCLITVGWKLAQRDQYPLSSVAEELALRATIEHAKGSIELLVEEGEIAQGRTRELHDELDGVIEAMAEDRDFEYLFNGRTPEGETARSLGLTDISFHNWFKPFAGSGRGQPHPYALE